MRKLIISALLKRIGDREPDLYIGGKEKPYLLRWYVIPRNKWFNIYCHRFMQSDTAVALHDHPWLFNISYLLRGAYEEWTPNKPPKRRRAGDLKFRWGKAPHRIELLPYIDYKLNEGAQYEVVEGVIPVDTLFITGPVVRKWGFYCPKGWRAWDSFLVKSEDARESIEKDGCGS